MRVGPTNLKADGSAGFIVEQSAVLKRPETRQVAVVLLLLALPFPNHHSPDFLAGALTCWTRMLVAPNMLILFLTEGENPIPGTGNDPPGAFLVSGLSMTLFGPTIAVARQAQVLFVVGPIAAMGWLGWQVAGRRGAILLGLGMATSAWM